MDLDTDKVLHSADCSVLMMRKHNIKEMGVAVSGSVEDRVATNFGDRIGLSPSHRSARVGQSTLNTIDNVFTPTGNSQSVIADTNGSSFDVRVVVPNCRSVLQDGNGEMGKGSLATL
jgi:hypothetical protein